MELDTTLLNTQHYKVRFKGKVEQWSRTLPYTPGVVAIEKGAFGSPSTMVANFTFFNFKSLKRPGSRVLSNIFCLGFLKTTSFLGF